MELLDRLFDIARRRNRKIVLPEGDDPRIIQAAARLKRANRTVQVSLPGGELTIEWRERDDHVLMTGTATFEYESRFDPALFAT